MLIAGKESVHSIDEVLPTPVSPVGKFWILTGVPKLSIRIKDAFILRWMENDYIEADDLDQNCHNVDQLESDENQEDSMVTRTDASIDPRAVVVVAFNTSLTHVAVITARQGDNFALKA